MKFIALILLAAFGLSTDVDRLRVIEFVRAPIGYLALVWVLSWIPGLRFLRNLHLNSRVLFLIIFTAVMSAQAVSHIVDTEIPRLKLIFRSIYFIYVIIITSSRGARIPPLPLALGTVFLFTSFPYTWSLNATYTMGTIRALPLFLGVLYLTLDEKIFERASFRDPLIWIPSAAMIAFALANVVNNNYTYGMEWLLRLGTGFLLFQLIRAGAERIPARQLLGVLALIGGMHAIFFLASIAFGIMEKPGLSYILAKRPHIAGINTNDIAGYLVFFLPLPAAMLLDRERRPRARTGLLWTLFFSCVFLLLVMKARAAWPVAAAGVALLFVMARREQVSPRLRRALLTGIVLLVLVFAIFAYTARDMLVMRVLLDSNTLSFRAAFWKLSAWLIVENPFFGLGAIEHAAISSVPILPELFEQGTQDHAFFTDSLIRYIHSHNMILQLWLDGGILYMGLFLLLFTMVLHRGLGSAVHSNNPLVLGGSIALVVVMLQGLLNFHFMDYADWLPMWALMGMVARGDPSSAKPLEQSPGDASPRMGITGLILTGLVLLASAYVGVFNWYHAGALNAVKDNRARDGRKNVVLLKGDPAGDAKRFARAEKNMRRALRMMPRDRNLMQLGGEIAHARLRVSANPASVKRALADQALKRLRKCIRLKPTSALCRIRAAAILEIRDPGNLKEVHELMAEARRLDPLRIRAKYPPRKF